MYFPRLFSSSYDTRSSTVFLFHPCVFCAGIPLTHIENMVKRRFILFPRPWRWKFVDFSSPSPEFIIWLVGSWLECGKIKQETRNLNTIRDGSKGTTTTRILSYFNFSLQFFHSRRLLRYNSCVCVDDVHNQKILSKKDSGFVACDPKLVVFSNEISGRWFCLLQEKLVQLDWLLW